MTPETCQSTDSISSKQGTDAADKANIALADAFAIYSVEEDEGYIRLSTFGHQVACWPVGSQPGIALLKLEAERQAALSAPALLPADVAGQVEWLQQEAERAAQFSTRYQEASRFSADWMERSLKLDSAAITIVSLQAENSALSARLERAEEVDKLREYAFEATKALTGLTIGGSEFFSGRIGDMFTADLPFCTQHIRERMGNRMEAIRAKAQSSLLKDEVERLRSALEEIENPIVFMQKRADDEGRQIDGAESCRLAEDAIYLRGIAREALAASGGPANV